MLPFFSLIGALSLAAASSVNIVVDNCPDRLLGQALYRIAVRASDISGQTFFPNQLEAEEGSIIAFMLENANQTIALLNPLTCRTIDNGSGFDLIGVGSGSPTMLFTVTCTQPQIFGLIDDASAGAGSSSSSSSSSSSDCLSSQSFFLNPGEEDVDRGYILPPVAEPISPATATAITSVAPYTPELPSFVRSLTHNYHYSWNTTTNSTNSTNESPTPTSYTNWASSYPYLPTPPTTPSTSGCRTAYTAGAQPCSQPAITTMALPHVTVIGGPSPTPAAAMTSTPTPSTRLVPSTSAPIASSRANRAMVMTVANLGGGLMAAMVLMLSSFF